MLATGAVPVAPDTDEAYGTWAAAPPADRPTAYHSTLEAALSTSTLAAGDLAEEGRADITLPAGTQFYPSRILVACMPEPGVSADPAGNWHLNFGQVGAGGSGTELFSNQNVGFGHIRDSVSFALDGPRRALVGTLRLAHHGAADGSINHRLRAVVCGVLLAVPV